MKRRLVGLLLCLASGVVDSATLSTADQYYTAMKRFVDTEEGHPPTPDAGLDEDAAYAYGYLMGMYDGMRTGVIGRKGNTSCAPTPASGTSLARTFMRYLDAHPAQRDASFFVSVIAAYIAAYPCLGPLRQPR